MSNKILGHGPHAAAICEALGIDPKTCAGIVLRLYPNEVATVTVERHVYDHEAQRLVTVLEKCNLVPPDDQPQEAAA